MRIVKTLEASLPGLVGVYLYGSQARGNSNAESDWDIAVLGAKAYEHPLLLEAATHLASGLHTEHVDLIDLFSASSVLIYQILSEGQCICQKDPIALSKFELKSLALYFDLNIERREILAEIKKRGKVF